MTRFDAWNVHPAQNALHFDSAVSVDESARFPNTRGLYAIWQPDFPHFGAVLLYVGKIDPKNQTGLRGRIDCYLRRASPGTKQRPNETLWTVIVDHVVRPDMKADNERGVVDIAVAYPNTCRFACWPCDDPAVHLKALENDAFAMGICGARPLLNDVRKRGIRGLAVPAPNATPPPVETGGGACSRRDES